jgi:hypothetical protein
MTRLSVLALAASVLLLTGCTPGTETPTAVDPTSSALPTPDVDDDPDVLGERPAARTAASCNDLFDPASLAGAFPAALALVDETRTAERIGTVISDGWNVRQAGGLLCEWQDADSLVTSEGYSGYHGIRLLLLPATTAQWEPYGIAEAGGGTRVSDCPYDDECHLDAFTGSWWLSVVARGIEAGDGGAVTAELDQVLSRVAELPAPTAPAPPDSGDLVPAACEQQLTAAQVLTATGASGTATVESPGYPSQWATARAAVGGTECGWAIDDYYGIYVTVLPGGAWALDIAAAAYGEATSVAIPGTTDGGVLRPQVEGLGLDFAYDGDWIQVVTYEGAYPRPGNDVLVSVAAAIVANSE